MGTSLTGVKIKDSYDSLLKVTDNGPLDGSLQVITDGLGNNSALSLSTAGASVGGTLAVSGAATLSSTLAVTGNLTVDTNTLFVDAASNRVGVGESNPAAKLHINDDGDGKIRLGSGSGMEIIHSNAGNTIAEIKQLYASSSANAQLKLTSGFTTFQVGTSGTEAMRIHSGGDISFRDSSANEAFYWDASAASLGIGESSLTGGNTILDLKHTGASKGTNIRFKNDYNSSFYVGISGDTAGDAIIYNQNNSNILFYTGAAGSERMRIDSSGNVTAYKLIQSTLGSGGISLSGNSSPDLGYIGYNYYNVDGTENVAQSIRNSWRVKFGNGSDKSLSFDYREPNAAVGAFTERVRITSGGYLKASNNGSYVAAGANYHELRNTTSDNQVLTISNTSASPYGEIIIFTNASPNNTINYFIGCEDSSGARIYLRSNGGIANYQANDVNLSDERVKTDISPLGSYWDKIKAIEIVNFKYKDQTHDDFNIGVIAQQVESVAPEFVDIDGFDNRPKLISEEVLDEEGNVIEEAVYEEPLAEPLKAVYTADLYHAAIKVLQEAMARIEVLETELNALKQA